MLSQQNRKNIAAFPVIIGTVLLFFSSVIFSHYTFGYGDLHRYFYPLRLYAASCIQSGILPLWNPYLFSGYPCFSALQLGVFYPLSAIVYSLPFYLGFNLYIVSHFLLAGISMYLLMREWKTGVTASLISALSYAFGGYMLSVVDMLTTLSAAAWTPLVFLFYTKAEVRRLKAEGTEGIKARSNTVVLSTSNLEKHNAREDAVLQNKGSIFDRLQPSAFSSVPSAFSLQPSAFSSIPSAFSLQPSAFSSVPSAFSLQPICYTILTGITLGIVFLGGEPSVWYMVCMTLGIYSIYCQWCQKRPAAAVTFILAVLISIAFFLPQLLPLLEMILHSTRSSGMELSHTISLSLKPWELVNLICPFFTGNYVDKNHFWFGQGWLESIYAGILPFLLAIFAVFTASGGSRKFCCRSAAGTASNGRRFWSLMLLFFLLIASGCIYQYLPGSHLIRYPVKFFCIAAFAVSILAGFGYESMNRHRKQFGWFVIVFAAWYLAAYLCCWIFSPKIINWIAASWQTTTPIDRLTVWYHATLKSAGFVLFTLFISITAMLLHWRGRIQSWVFSLVIIAIVILDLFIAGEKINPVFDAGLYSYTSKAASFLKQDPTCFRIYMEPETEKYYRIIRGQSLDDALKNVQDVLVPNTTLFYNLFDTWGYESLNLGDYSRVIDLINQSGAYHLLSMLNIKYILSCFQVQNPAFKHIYNDGKLNIYANPSCLPRAFCVPECMVIKDRARILEKLMEIDPRQVVIIEEAEGRRLKVEGTEKEAEGRRLKAEGTEKEAEGRRLKAEGTEKEAEGRRLKAEGTEKEAEGRRLKAEGTEKEADVKIASQQVQIVKYLPNAVLIRVSTNQDGFLFLSDTYYPGWYALVDGVKTRVYRANYAFRAIRIKAGTHRVEFRYKPASLIIGCWASLAAILLVAAGGWVRVRRGC